MDEWGHNGTYDTPNLKRVNKAIDDFEDMDDPFMFLLKELGRFYPDQVKQVVGLKEWPILK